MEFGIKLLKMLKNLLNTEECQLYYVHIPPENNNLIVFHIDHPTWQEDDAIYLKIPIDKLYNSNNEKLIRSLYLKEKYETLLSNELRNNNIIDYSIKQCEITINILKSVKIDDPNYLVVLNHFETKLEKLNEQKLDSMSKIAKYENKLIQASINLQEDECDHNSKFKLNDKYLSKIYDPILSLQEVIDKYEKSTITDIYISDDIVKFKTQELKLDNDDDRHYHSISTLNEIITMDVMDFINNNTYITKKDVEYILNTSTNPIFENIANKMKKFNDGSKEFEMAIREIRSEQFPAPDIKFD